MNYQQLRGIVSPASARLAVSLAALAMITGCSALSDAMQSDRIDYKSNAKRTSSLEVPPDLTNLQGDRRYAAPEVAGSTTTLSGYQQRMTTQQATGTVNALPTVQGMRVERDGNQRWLVIQGASAAQVWPPLREFWQENGFLLAIDSPETGIMETDWAENRAKIPQDFIRNTIGKVFDSMYSTSERDRFRTRVEKGPNDTLEIFISHRGVREELTGMSKESSVWAPRPVDPELEAEFLSRLMQRLGMSREAAQSTLAASNNAGAAPGGASGAPAAAGTSLIRQVNGADVLVLNEPFDRAWRAVGLALDRVNFTVEDRDRAQGIYFVRYVDTRDQAKQPGFFSRLFSRSAAEEAKRAKRYRVAVQSGANGSMVSVLNESGAPEKSDINRQILTLLNEQLR
jgi:outer membrane protein assembly factor BamC